LSDTAALADRRLLMVVNTDWFFLSHRAAIAQAALELGMRVTICAGSTGRESEIRDLGLDFVDLPLSRQGINPSRELVDIYRLRAIYRQVAPDLIHQVGPKPVAYGSIAAAGSGARIINAISGLGYAFTNLDRPSRLRPIVLRLYRRALCRQGVLTIFQNIDDRDLFVNLGIVPRTNSALIRGSGVDCERFGAQPEPGGEIVVMFPARVLRDKGILEFVRAIEILKERESAKLLPRFRAVIVGRLDEGNPSSITHEELSDWVDRRLVENWGHSQDMASTLARAHIVVLPSLREGLPKVLLEASAVGRPVIATDVPGCRECCIPEYNGLLVPPKQPATLARAIERLIVDDELRQAFGRRGRALVESNFSLDHVVSSTLSLYVQQLAAVGNR
jgi:glycosyltransferase involved in cell wall biosynthesis